MEPNPDTIIARLLLKVRYCTCVEVSRSRRALLEILPLLRAAWVQLHLSIRRLAFHLHWPAVR